MRTLIAMVLALAWMPVAAPAASKPNIVFILTDDQAPDTLAAWGTWGNDGRVVRTPNLDRLAAAGTSFRHAYNMGAWTGAVCIPSRTMLNTGRFVWAAEKAEKAGFRQERSRGQFWSQRLKAAGYDTYFTGKWHVSTQVTNLFDHVVNVRKGFVGDSPIAYSRPVEGRPDPWIPWDPANGGFWEGGRHLSEVLAEDAAGFIRQASARKNPFFMYLAFNAPHDPRQSPRDLVESYPLEKVPLPENFLPLYPHHEPMGLGPATGKALRDEALAPFPRTAYAVRKHRQEYYAIVTHLDRQIGRVLDALDQSGLAGSTYIFFTSDQGLAVGRHGLFGKQNLFEHSVRVPFILAGPGIPRGRTIDTRIYLQDAMATVLDLAGADRDQVDFRSVLPLIRGERQTQYDAIYGGYLDRAQRSVIRGDHKLILYPKAKVALLYNLARDPLEMRDLAGDPETLGLRRELFARLLALQREVGDGLNLAEVYPDLAP